MTASSAWAMSSTEAGSSGRDLGMEDVETENLGSVKSRGDCQNVELGEYASFVSQPSEGILLVNPRSTVKEED